MVGTLGGGGEMNAPFPPPPKTNLVVYSFSKVVSQEVAFPIFSQQLSLAMMPRPLDLAIFVWTMMKQMAKLFTLVYPLHMYVHKLVLY